MGRTETLPRFFLLIALPLPDGHLEVLTIQRFFFFMNGAGWWTMIENVLEGWRLQRYFEANSEIMNHHDSDPAGAQWGKKIRDPGNSKFAIAALAFFLMRVPGSGFAQVVLRFSYNQTRWQSIFFPRFSEAFQSRDWPVASKALLTQFCLVPQLGTGNRVFLLSMGNVEKPTRRPKKQPRPAEKRNHIRNAEEFWSV